MFLLSKTISKHSFYEIDFKIEPSGPKNFQNFSFKISLQKYIPKSDNSVDINNFINLIFGTSHHVDL